MSEIKFDYSFDPYGNVIDIHSYPTELIDIPITTGELSEMIYFEAIARDIIEHKHPKS